MAEPQLLVDKAERLVDCTALVRPDLDVRKSQKLQNLVLRSPHAAKLILGPTSGRRGNDFPLGRTLASPTASLEILFEYLDRCAVVTLVLYFFHAQNHPPEFASSLPPRLLVLASSSASS